MNKLGKYVSKKRTFIEELMKFIDNNYVKGYKNKTISQQFNPNPKQR